VQTATIFLPILLIYAAAIAIAAWFVMHIEKRKVWQQRFQLLCTRVSRNFDKSFGFLYKRTSSVQSGLQEAGAQILRTGTHYRKLLLISSVILITPIIVAIAIRPDHVLEGYADLPQSTDPVIIALLQGEQLVPPPPLPPEIFTTQEVEAVRQDLSGASREWMMLDSDFKQRLLTVFQLMAKHGYQMALLEGYRSPERQTYLSSLGTQVTNVGAYQSYHQYGLAADSAFLRDGKLIISEKDPWAMEGYRLYGRYAESVGLTWGGRWKLMDFGHIELQKRHVLGKH
jgi:peptidoglycan L-alanyl-D-glutamate endopeptidase CwlK